jgi:hypothetical protein
MRIRISMLLSYVKKETHSKNTYLIMLFFSRGLMARAVVTFVTTKVLSF